MFQGFKPLDSKPVQEQYRGLFDPCNQRFMPRAAAEADPSFKQLIPYIIVADPADDDVLTYWRGGGGGEKRLHGKRSIGIGGHINPGDSTGDGCSTDHYLNGMVRELTEELIFAPEPDIIAPPVLGLLNDDSNEVGSVHLGVVHYLELPEGCQVRAREPEIFELEFCWLSQLTAHRHAFETWSQLCIDELNTRAQMAKSAEQCRTTG
jgi:predicted NUDIX family phosphoesterase